MRVEGVRFQISDLVVQSKVKSAIVLKPSWTPGARVTALSVWRCACHLVSKRPRRSRATVDALTPRCGKSFLINSLCRPRRHRQSIGRRSTLLITEEQNRTGCGQSGSVDDQPQYRRLWRCRSSSALSPLSSPSFAHVLTRPKDKSLGRARNARPPGAQPRGRHARRTPYPEAYGRSILGCEG